MLTTNSSLVDWSGLITLKPSKWRRADSILCLKAQQPQPYLPPSDRKSPTPQLNLIKLSGTKLVSDYRPGLCSNTPRVTPQPSTVVSAHSDLNQSDCIEGCIEELLVSLNSNKKTQHQPQPRKSFDTDVSNTVSEVMTITN